MVAEPTGDRLVLLVPGRSTRRCGLVASCSRWLSEPDHLREEHLPRQRPDPPDTARLGRVPYSEGSVSGAPYQQLRSRRVPPSGVPPFRQALSGAVGADELGRAAPGGAPRGGDCDPRRFLAPPKGTQSRT